MEHARPVCDSDVRRRPGTELRRSAGIARPPGTSDRDGFRVSRAAAGLGPSAAPGLVRDVLSTPGSPLAPSLRADMEQRLGHDFSTVRIHADARAARSAAAIASLAYTVGDHVVLGSAVTTGAQSRRILAHELVHTIQQRGTPPPVGGPLKVSDPADTGEAEAENLAQSAMRMAADPRDVRAGHQSLVSIQRETAGDVPELKFEPAINKPPCACIAFVHNDERKARATARQLHTNCRYSLRPPEVAGRVGR